MELVITASTLDTAWDIVPRPGLLSRRWPLRALALQGATLGVLPAEARERELSWRRWALCCLDLSGWDECIQPNAEREAERGSHSAKKLATNAPG